MPGAFFVGYAALSNTLQRSRLNPQSGHRVGPCRDCGSTIVCSDQTGTDIKMRIEPPGNFRLLQSLSPSAFESVSENLGLRSYRDLARYLWAEWRFDRRYGVRTEYLVPTAELGFSDAALQSGASRYRATPPHCVAVSLARLSEHLGGLGGHGMVDYGCGAGRVIILGAEAGLDRVTGLELSPPLVAQANDNLSRYRERSGSQCQFTVLEADATTYVPPAEMDIFYFFNPFSPDLFERTVDGIRTSVRAHPRPIYLLLFQTFRYQVNGLDLIGSVTGVQTYSNAAAPEVFLKG